jgi:Cdc6-like AAA superfamily ATPase
MPNMIADAQIGKAVAKMRTRSERQTDAKKLAEAFVDVGILQQIQSTNHQIIFGRRGTGKTHVLKVYEYGCREENRPVVYIDARTFGSSSQFLDPSLPMAQRCTAIFRDLLAAIHNPLREFAWSQSNVANETLELVEAFADVVVERPLWWTPFFGHEKGLFLDGGRH